MAADRNLLFGVILARRALLRAAAVSPGALREVVETAVMPEPDVD